LYIEEIPSGVRTISGVSTSDTAFVDFFARGPIDEAVRITSFGDFERVFGGLDTRSEASYAIAQFFTNGGSVAWVVRVGASNVATATAGLTDGYNPGDLLIVSAASPGAWGNNLQVAVDRNPKNLDPRKAGTVFNLVVREVQTVAGRAQVVNLEIHRNLSMDKTDSRYAIDVVNSASLLVALSGGPANTGNLPQATGTDVINNPQDSDFLPLGVSPHQAGADGYEPGSSNWNSSEGSAALIGDQSKQSGMYALGAIAPYIFNILCIPAAPALSAASMGAVYTAALTLCDDERAFLIVDIPDSVGTVEEMSKWADDNAALRDTNSAVYFPRLSIPDPLNENRDRDVPSSGTVAGVYARTDSTRGVWKAPAGTDAVLRGATINVKLTDGQNGGLNPLGLNVLRNFPIFGGVVWGARTLEGADQMASEWKYIPVRRIALYIEESLFQGLKWVVFEPNDEPLWAQIRLNVGAFMQNLFRQGAFQGTTPRDAYFVKCDKETTTQNDIDRGIVNIVVGFAPLKPAEFVVIKIQQMAGQIQV
jgi:phage tail sheath protein FI